MRSKWLSTLCFSIFVACVAQLPACSTRDPASSNERESGTLSLALATTSQGRSYRLRQASFDVAGPSHATLDSEQDPDAPSLSTQLDPGSYEITLNGPWFLERLDPDGPVRLTASLLSDNPAPVEIASGSTSSVVFRFATDGTTVALGNGGLAIGVEVEDTSASTLASGLQVLAGRPGGWGFADGVGDQARIGYPYTIAANEDGDLIVNDGNFLRKIAGTSGAVTTLFLNHGSTNPQELCPLGMVAIANTVYFCNCDATIRKLATDTGDVTVLAGARYIYGNVDGIGDDARFTYPVGLASDGMGNLYVSDGSAQLIRKLVLTTGEVTTLAGSPDEVGTADGVGSDARFSFPYDLTLNGDGNLYVADSGAVRRIALATREVSTLAGQDSDPNGIADGIGSAARFHSLNAITHDNSGNLYVSDFCTVRQVAIGTGEVTTLAGQAGDYSSADGIGTNARFNSALGLLQLNGQLFVADNGGTAIRKLALDSNTVTTFAGSARHVGNQDGIRLEVSFADPQSAVSDGLGNLYVADPTTHTIRKIVVATGLTSTFAGNPNEAGNVDGIGTAARFDAPWGITRDGRGNLYVTDFNDQTVRKIVPSTGEVSTVFGKTGHSGTADGVGLSATFSRPALITSDGADHLYVGDDFAQAIRKLDLQSRLVTTLVTVQSGFPSFQGLASDRAGNLYFSSGSNISRFVLDTGAIVPVAGSDDYGFVDGVGGTARFQGPGALAFDRAGQLYVVDGNIIRKIDLATATVSTVVGRPSELHGVLPGPLPGRLNYPTSLAVLSGGLGIIDEGVILSAGF